MPKQFSRAEVQQFMLEQSVMSVAIHGIDDNPPVSSVLLFAMDEDFTLYFGTQTDSYKAQALRHDPKISLSIWQEGEMLVQAHGVAEEIADAVATDAALAKLSTAALGKEHFWPPVVQIKGHAYAAFKVRLSWMRVLDLSSKNLVASESLFTEVPLHE